MAENTTGARPRRLTRRALAQLRRPLDEALVSERTTDDGDLIRYLEGHIVIEQANRIFGHDGWGAEVVGEVGYRPLKAGNSAAIGLYTATVRVRVTGCPPRSDVGCAIVAENSADAHTTAYKGAVTDAMKRALRHFGDQFGNALYTGARERAEAEVSAPILPVSAESADTLRRRVMEIASNGGSDEARTREWVTQRYGRPLEELDAPALGDAVQTLSSGLNRRNGKAQAA